nr:MAG TPA: hypothetical protein [Caudoviricetes sp.]
MKKKLSQTAQIKLLKHLRRMCPFAVFSGSYGYTCGGLVGGGYALLRAWQLVRRKLYIARSHASTCASKHLHMATT